MASNFRMLAFINQEANKYFEFKIFPNPSPGSFTIQIDSEKEEAATLEVINLQGQLLYSDILALQPGQQDHPVHLGKFSAGIYLVKITTPGQTGIQKIIILIV